MMNMIELFVTAACRAGLMRISADKALIPMGRTSLSLLTDRLGWRNVGNEARCEGWVDGGVLAEL